MRIGSSPAWLPSFFIWALSLLMSSVYFFLPLHLKNNLHFSGLEIGILYAAASLNALLVTFPLGVAGDRYPLLPLLRGALLLSGLCLWGLGHLRDYLAYLVAFWGFGLGLHAFRIALDTLVFKSTGADSVRVLSRYNAWRMAGMMTGTLLGGFLFYRLGFAESLQLLALVPVLLVLPTFKLPRLAVHYSPLWQYGRDFCHRPVLFFATWLFLFCLHWGAETTSYGLFLQERLGLTPQGMGLYMAVEFGVLAVTAYLYGRFWYGRLSPLTFLSLALRHLGPGAYPHDHPQRRRLPELAGGARVRRRPHPHGKLYHHRPPLPRGPHRRQLQPHQPGERQRQFCRGLDLRAHGCRLRVPMAPDRVRHHQPVPSAPGLLGAESQPRPGSVLVDGGLK